MKKQTEEQYKKMYEDRIAVMQTMLDGLHQALQDEINTNAALNAELIEARRQADINTGRTS